jgi:hypothetical protein
MKAQPTTTHRLLAAMLVLLAFTAPVAFGQFASTGTTTLSVNVATEAAIQINTSTTNLTNSGTNFNVDYTGTTSFTYKVRTTQSSGAGDITLRITSDFSPTGGPSVGTPPSGGDALTYTCVVSAPGTACTGSQTSSTSAQTNVAAFGADAHSVKAGNSGSVSWNLTNDPVYKTGPYNATATFTISST